MTPLSDAISGQGRDFIAGQGNDLHKIETDSLLKPMSYLAGAIGEWRLLAQLDGHIPPQPISFEVRTGFMKSADMVKEAALALSMPAAARVVQQDWESILRILALRRPLSPHELGQVTTYADKLLSVFVAEASGATLIALSADAAPYLDPAEPLFGKAVDTAFPSARRDIHDAGRCRALGLWTACVMHLMRALEPALQALADWVGVEAASNWNAALNQIDAALREMRKSTHGAEDEQWAAEASLQLRAVKNAWRNHAMHGVGRYDETDAIRVFDSVKYLMQTLGTRLTD